MTEVKQKTTETSEIHERLLSNTVNERVLNILGMNPHYIELLKRNKIIPCTVKQFTAMEGAWVKQIVESVKMLLWTEDGNPLCAHAAFGNEMFHYDDESGETFVGFTRLGEQSVHSTYRMSDGRVIKQAIVDTDSGEVINALVDCKYQGDKLKETITPVLVPASDQQTYVDTGTVNIERYLFDGEFCVEEVYASVQKDRKGRLPKITRDMFDTKIKHEYVDGKQVRSLIPDVLGKTAVVNFEYDEKGNLTRQVQDSGVVAEISNTYMTDGRLLTMVRHDRVGKTLVDMGGRYEKATEDKDVVLIDLTEYYQV